MISFSPFVAHGQDAGPAAALVPAGQSGCTTAKCHRGIVRIRQPGSQMSKRILTRGKINTELMEIVLICPGEADI